MSKRPLGARGRLWARLGIAVWFLAMLAVGATLLARHAVALPRPQVDSAFEQAMNALRAPGDRQRWLAVHVLYVQCRCSQRIADHLLTTRRPTDVSERVLLIGSDDALASRLTTGGFRVIETNVADAARIYHVPSAPLFVAVSPTGQVRYAGGYTTVKQGPDPRDLQILADARAGESPASLPIFGCAVSARLREALNPLGLP